MEADRLVGASKGWNKIGHALGTLAAGWGGLIIASHYPCVSEVSHQETLESSTGDVTQSAFVWFRLKSTCGEFPASAQSTYLIKLFASAPLLLHYASH